MDLRNRRALKDAARRSLAAAPNDPGRIILIHTGVSVAVSLIATLINFIFGQQIANTGGLSGLGTRSMLSTAQSVLQLAVTFGLPFWEAGYCFATINMTREKETTPGSLLEGFRRFGPLLRCTLLQALIYLGVGIVCFFLSTQIYLITPLSDPLYEIAQSLTADTTMLNSAIVLDEATQIAIMEAYTPMLLIFLVVFLAGALFISYNYRMATYLILDHPGMGALEALRTSTSQLRGHKLSLFKLDLSFWWFYVLQILAAILAYGDYLLPLLGFPLPVSSDAAFFIFLLLSLVGQGGLYVWARNRVEVTYAKVYDITALPKSEKPEQTPPDNPWSN